MKVLNYYCQFKKIEFEILKFKLKNCVNFTENQKNTIHTIVLSTLKIIFFSNLTHYYFTNFWWEFYSSY